MLQLLMPPSVTIVIDVLGWGVFHAVTGYVAHRLGNDVLDRDGWLLRLRAFETGGRWYRRRALVDRWKDAVPEAGRLFHGVSKRHLLSYDVAGLTAFVREARRAELAHWSATCCGPLFVVWNPPVAAVLLIGYGVVVNLPFIVIQRYNRGRALALIDRRLR